MSHIKEDIFLHYGSDFVWEAAWGEDVSAHTWQMVIHDGVEGSGATEILTTGGFVNGAGTDITITGDSGGAFKIKIAETKVNAERGNITKGYYTIQHNDGTDVLRMMEGNAYYVDNSGT